MVIIALMHILYSRMNVDKIIGLVSNGPTLSVDFT